MTRHNWLTPLALTLIALELLAVLDLLDRLDKANRKAGLTLIHGGGGVS